jgi:hypothetical protein
VLKSLRQDEIDSISTKQSSVNTWDIIFFFVTSSDFFFEIYVEYFSTFATVEITNSI